MATYNLGKVCITPKGAYSPTTQYEALDVVSYAGASYLVLQEVRGTTPVEGAYYMLLTSRGAKGETGQSATINVGTVTSLPVGSTPTVTNVGTENNAIFNFGLVQGANGNVSSVDSVAGVGGNVALSAVRYSVQSLSDAQKTQARTNIGATLNGIGAASKPNSSDSISFPYSTWEGSTSCTLTVSGKGIISTSIVFIEPTSDSYENWTKFGVRCVSGGTNTLSFVCKSTPNVNLAFKLVVWNG